MTGKNSPPGNNSPQVTTGQALRRLAEDIFLEEDARASESFRDMLTETARHKVFELSVQQIELEIQNDELRKAQDALRAAVDFSNSLICSMQDGFYVLDASGVTLEANPALCRMTGFSREALIGKAMPRPFWPPEECERIQSVIRQAIETEVTDVELIFMRENGERFPVIINPWAVRNREGNAISYVAIVKDVTERKQAEIERARLEARLQQSQKLESVGRLAGGVAHDFNNMLAVILGHAELVLQHMGPEQSAYSDIMEIQKAAARSADLTRQLLAFARQQTVVPKVLDLNETIAGILMLLQRLIGEDIALVWQPAEVLWSVEMDPSQLDQVLTNLCVNARDAINGVGVITIEAENCDVDAEYCAAYVGLMPGEYVRLTVCDTGSGMDAATQAQIFEPFFTTKAVGKGTGLGLATVYGAIKQNQGYITVFSELGRGTMFEIYLPCYSGGIQPVSVLMEDMSSLVQRGRETILLVEDEPAILMFSTRVLEAKGYVVLGAGSPGEAMDMAKSHAGDIHLLLSDVVMPGMNGHDLAEALVLLYPRIRCLFMSGYTADVIAENGILDDGIHFIQKPFSIADLTANVRKVLDQLIPTQ